MKCQQYELYSAENHIWIGREFKSEAELQEFVDSLRELDYWEANFPQVKRIEAFEIPGGRGSVGEWFPLRSCGQIEMCPGHRNQLTVLHEVSHVVAAARYGSQSHDPWFARTYLELVSLVMGSETYQALARAFDQKGVDYATNSSAPVGIPLGGG